MIGQLQFSPKKVKKRVNEQEDFLSSKTAIRPCHVGDSLTSAEEDVEERELCRMEAKGSSPSGCRREEIGNKRCVEREGILETREDGINPKMFNCEGSAKIPGF